MVQALQLPSAQQTMLLVCILLGGRRLSPAPKKLCSTDMQSAIQASPKHPAQMDSDSQRMAACTQTACTPCTAYACTSISV